MIITNDIGVKVFLKSAYPILQVEWHFMYNKTVKNLTSIFLKADMSYVLLSL